MIWLIPKISIVNREKGSGARVLLDEQLRINGISPDLLKGYKHELTSHFSIASAVASGQADVGVGIESVAKIGQCGLYSFNQGTL